MGDGDHLEWHATSHVLLGALRLGELQTCLNYVENYVMKNRIVSFLFTCYFTNG